MAFTVGNEQKNIFSKLRKMTPANRLDMFKKYGSGEGSTPFSLLTPAQFAELFPKYYMEKLPDVGGFFKALNSKKELGGEGKTYGPHGNTEGTASVTSGGDKRITNVVKAKEIYDYIRSKGVDHVHAVGIVNNIRHESNFDSGIKGDGDTSGGLFQHHDGRDVHRFSNMKAYVGEDWQKNWKKQIDYAMTESEMKRYLQTNPSNVQDASKNFTIIFENPANAQSKAAERAETAQKYSDVVSGPGLSTTTTSGNFETTSSGYVVPKDKGIYSPGNEQQCATLAKGFNPEIGRSSSWTVVPGEIKPGVTVATMRYNLPGGDRTGSGYHSGVAMSAPDKDGNFLLLEQFNGQPARVRQVNVKYGGGAMGGSTEFGIISSNGKLHTEQSMEALNYGAKVSGQENQKIIQSNINALSNGNTAGVTQGVADSGSVSIPTDQPQTNLQQQDAVNNIQTATIGDMFRMVGDLAGFFMRGEGLGGGGRKGHHKKSKGSKGGGMRVTDEERAFNVEYDPNIGKVAQQFEGRKGVETVSSGFMRKGKKQVADPGGVSYGAHQLSSKTKGRATGGTMAEFLKSSEGQAWTDQFKGMMPGTKKFTDKYNEIVNNPESKQKLAEDQHKFIYRTHYVPTVQRAHRLGYDVNDPYVKEALYSASVQYRNNAKSIIARPEAMAGIGKPGLQQGAAIYDARNVFGHGQFQTRIKDEKTALASLQPPVRTNTPTATVAKAEPPTPAPSAPSYLDQIKSKMSGAYEGVVNRIAGLRESVLSKTSTAAPVAPEFPAIGAKQNEVPLPPHRPKTFDNEPGAAAPADKQTFNVDRPTDVPASKPIVADTFMNRSNPQFSSPSMERQIKNTMNPVASNEDHSFLPSIG